jgi:nucleoside-diphosphate-sugar epimerase
MPRLLIAGCGYVGEAAADRFHESGWDVEGWTASEESAARLSDRPFPVRAVDMTRGGVASHQFDVVIHCASSRGGDEGEYRRIYFEGGKNLLRLFPDATLLFSSSTSVFAQADGSLVDEESPAEPLHLKGQILREAEDLVLSAGGIVARLGGIHGPGRSFFLSRFLEGASSNEDDRLINYVHRDDIVSALQLLVERRAECRRGIFNVVGDQPITARDANAWLGSRVKRSSSAARARARSRERGRGNKKVSNQKLRALGWRPRYPTFEVAMSESILASFGF